MNTEDVDFPLKKSRDQFFLKNELILDEEVLLADLRKGDTVLEVGAGTGNLTRKLAEKCPVIAIELDRRFFSFLVNVPNAKIIYGNALDILKTVRKNKEFYFNKIVSNIPYSISQKLVLELLKHRWEIAVLVVQKEFAYKLVEKSKLGMLLEDCADVEIAEIIPKENFYPEAVDSALIILKQKKTMDEGLWKFLEVAYRSRNKNVSNVVKNCPSDYAKKKVHQLSLDELKKLYEHG